MFHYDFHIAGLLLRVTSRFSLPQLHELSAFQTEYDQDRLPDAQYRIDLLPDDWQILGNKIIDDCHTAIYQHQDEIHRYFYWNVYTNNRFVLLRHSRQAPTNCSIYLQSETLERILPQFRLSAFLAPERLFLRYNGFLLHASVIEVNGGGILFTAPSGTGKSTQASLWARLRGAQILNGDRAVIRHENGIFYAYGSPYAGTSGIYRNQRVPIRAIVVLSQSDTNKLSPLSSLSAFQMLYRETTTYAWDNEFVDQLSGLLLNLIEAVPVYSLACRPDEGAVSILEQELMK